MNKDFSAMTVPELEQHLIKLWDKADRLPSGSPEYNTIVDEVLEIHNYACVNSIQFPVEIAARFQQSANIRSLGKERMFFFYVNEIYANPFQSKHLMNIKTLSF